MGTLLTDEKKEQKIVDFQNNPNIGKFLALVDEYKGNNGFLKRLLEVLDEQEIINKFYYIESNCKDKISIIENTVYDNKNIDNACLRKLIIILLYYENNYNKSEEVLNKIVKTNLKNMLFDIMLDYYDKFESYFSFNDTNIYWKFIKYSLNKDSVNKEKENFSKAIKYLSNKFKQLKIINQNRNNFLKYKRELTIKYRKLDDYYNAYNIIQDIIEFMKTSGKQFIIFEKYFWENYYNSYIKKNKEENSIRDFYELFSSYIDLIGDISYKEELAKKIDEDIVNKIKGNIEVKKQLELLFFNDPYYIDINYKKYRNPHIFQNINIFDLDKKDDIEYFQKIDLEDIYGDGEPFKNYLFVIINKVNSIQDFICIIKLTKIKKKQNKNEYINLLIKRYEEFDEIDLTDESFLLLLGKVNDYNQNKRLELIKDCLPRFKQNNIYLQILEIYNTDNNIKQLIAISSIENLDLYTLIDLIKNIKEEQKKEYFNNLANPNNPLSPKDLQKQNIIDYEDFLKIEETKNLKLLTELMKNGLIPGGIYLDKSKNSLNDIYEKLSTYDELKSIYLDTIINEKEEIRKIFVKRFEIFKLVKGNEFDPELEFNKIIDKYFKAKEYIEKAYRISYLLSFFYSETYKEAINWINNIYSDYSNNDNKINIWINKENEIIKFISEYEDKANLINIVKEMQLFKIIYTEFTKGDEITRFDKAKELFDECKIIFIDINKGNIDILNKWQNKFKKEKGIEEELQKLKNYYKIDNNEKENAIAKKIQIFTKKSIYYDDIKCLLYFIKLFESDETEFSEILKEKKKEFEDKEHLNFEKLEKINNYLEEKQIYINDGKDDSPLIQFVRLLNNKENEINFIKTKDIDSAAALMYKLNPTTDSLKFKDILGYQSCIDFINDINEKITDEKLLEKIIEKLSKNNLNIVLSTFKSYFINYGSIKTLDSNFNSSKDIYQNIKFILNNSVYKLELFRREFHVYEDNENKKEKKEIEIIAKDLDGLIKLKDNINLNFEDLPDNKKINENKKKKNRRKKN